LEKDRFVWPIRQQSQFFWDDKRKRNVRVIGSIDDGGIRAFVPLTRSLLISPSENVPPDASLGVGKPYKSQKCSQRLPAFSSRADADAHLFGKRNERIHQIPKLFAAILIIAPVAARAAAYRRLRSNPAEQNQDHQNGQNQA
jgi:hypothetical protein